MTRATSKQNYGGQPITAVASVRDKFEKTRGNLTKSKYAKTLKEFMELEDNSFADVGLAASIPVFPTEHNYIGSPRNAPRPMPSSGTPIHELRARANAVRAALTSNLPQPQLSMRA